MYSIINGVTVRKDLPDILNFFKTSKYPWYSEVGYLDADNVKHQEPQELDTGYTMYGISGDAQNPVEDVIQVIKDTVPSGDASIVWVDPGATAHDNVDGVVSYSITVIPDIYKEGYYLVEYVATNSEGKTGTTCREVIVNTFGAISIVLKGGNLTLKVGDTYNEPGYIAMDAMRNAIYDVTVSGIVNTGVVGQYTLSYSISQDGVEKFVTRIITVEE